MNALVDPLLFALANLIKLGLLCLIWHLAREAGKDSRGRSPLWQEYGKVVGACVVLAGLSWANYGTHVEDADPIRGGGQVVSDFEPTKDEQNAHGLTLFFTLTPVAVHGFRRGRGD